MSSNGKWEDKNFLSDSIPLTANRFVAYEPHPQDDYPSITGGDPNHFMQGPGQTDY